MCLCPSAVPEFRALVGNEAVEELQCSVGDAVQTGQVLKKCFTKMMNCEKKVFVDQLNMLVKRVSEEGERHTLTFDVTQHLMDSSQCVCTKCSVLLKQGLSITRWNVF